MAGARKGDAVIEGREVWEMGGLGERPVGVGAGSVDNVSAARTSRMNPH